MKIFQRSQLLKLKCLKNFQFLLYAKKSTITDRYTYFMIRIIVSMAVLSLKDYYLARLGKRLPARYPNNV